MMASEPSLIYVLRGDTNVLVKIVMLFSKKIVYLSSRDVINYIETVRKGEIYVR